MATETETGAGNVVSHVCPFCGESVQDEKGKNINLIVHMGLWTQKHLSKREWADYIHAINLRAF